MDSSWFARNLSVNAMNYEWRGNLLFKCWMEHRRMLERQVQKLAKFPKFNTDEKKSEKSRKEKALECAFDTIHIDLFSEYFFFLQIKVVSS